MPIYLVTGVSLAICGIIIWLLMQFINTTLTSITHSLEAIAQNRIELGKYLIKLEDDMHELDAMYRHLQTNIQIHDKEYETMRNYFQNSMMALQAQLKELMELTNQTQGPPDLN